MPTVRLTDAQLADLIAKGAIVGPPVRLGQPQREELPEGIDEAAFTEALIRKAQECGWLACHFRAAKTAKGWVTAIQGDKGFPDVILIRPPVAVVAELKVPPNKPTPEQEQWLAAFRKTPGILTFIWHPADWTEIVRLLEGR